MKTSSRHFLILLAAPIFWAASAGDVDCQGLRGSLEPIDRYEFAPPPSPELKYKHDPQNPKLILNPDFYCTQCIKEKRVSYKSRDELKSILETRVIYPHTIQGKNSRVHGRHRLVEHDADVVLDYLFKKMKSRRPIYIEDKTFRLYIDLDGFSTKKHRYPRRKTELKELSDIFPRVSEKTVKLDSHQRAHLYLNRAHRVYRDFTHIVDFKPNAKYMAYRGPYLGVKEKFEIFVFPKQRLLGEFVNTFLGHPVTLEGECWHTLKDDSMISIMNAENMHDVWLNNTFTHHLAFNFCDAFRGYGYNLPSWFSLGFGHLMERRERTDFNTFFYGEGREPDELWGRSRWKPEIRKMVLKDKVRPLVELAQYTHKNEITPPEHGPAWSLVSYQMQLGTEKFGQFIHILKDKKQGESIYNLQVRAFRTVYKTSITQFFEDWKTWVLKTYPPL